ncbi:MULTISPECIES: acyl-CoA desaturase [Acinetobacter]|jgi:stearoyl-CoA desaturase (delta-9 desaturase)|uniref:Acyl-CoA desaturase n=1 Tax=Acinetobacter bereziniae TaxID=106648 RepID=A0A8I1DH69_ACIBZ|nr:MULTISPECIES: acyl-CoA desaturase [Acinetobacter]MEC8125772.1 acyl-CoA desaturase [Pseudomonadota bacterium]MBJ8450518.1 acyl-CoA desaturase [Acinetobacter bereziniae]MBJ8455540.1 acyl-CoA desaturase [Acinetobacter bereziniae]MBJ8551150.1 acyl-CoA desaturase [Acinetobacter bereziniae]MBJ9370726.1 acyl-CoA desaturase [Acinetobacter sp. TGL-Y2]
MLNRVRQWIDSWSRPIQVQTSSSESKKIQWVRIIPFIILHVACLGIFYVGVSWFAVTFMLLFYLIRMFSITAFFHRYLSHKTFQTSRIVQFVFVLIGTMSAQRGPLWWAAHHRYHHRFTDTEHDPHSSTYGFWYSHLGWFLNDYNFATRKEVVKDWLKYPELVWLDRFSLIIVLLTAVSIYALGEWLAVVYPSLATSGLQLLVWGFVVSTVLLIHATLCINSLAHLYGSRDFETEDQSRNNLFLSIITLGEGWHNNHHYYAGSARQGFYWWQIDITYYLLKMMSWIGLVWGLKPIPARVYEFSKIAQSATKVNIFIKTNTNKSSTGESS